MIVVAGHLIAMKQAHARIPSSRHRIRSVIGGVVMLTIPTLVFAFSFTSRADPAMFLRAWTAAIGLLGIVVVLASVDALNSLRLGRSLQREARAAFHAEIAETRRRIAEARAADPNMRDTPNLRLVSDEDSDRAD
ncbi:MAG: hypothetical protein AAGI17_06805 [Planctomycetota bacterium]